MHKSFEDPIDFLPDVTPRQQTVVVRPKILPGLYDWLRFGESREDWVELFGLNLEQIDEQAATVYLEGEKKYFGRFADHCIRAVGPERFFAMKQAKLELIRGRFIHAATHLCGKMDDGKRSPIEQIMLAVSLWARYRYEKTARDMGFDIGFGQAASGCRDRPAISNRKLPHRPCRLY
jgi:hypothetical protein